MPIVIEILIEIAFDPAFDPADDAFVPADAAFAPDVADDSSCFFRAAAALAFGLSGRVLLTKDTLSACADFVCLTSPPVL